MTTTASEDDRRLWNLRARARENMVDRLCKRDLPVADSDALWIGWVGPITATNRPAALLEDLARLERLIDDPMNAVRIAIAGEPGDAAGHATLAQIVEIANNPRFEGRVVYVSGAGAGEILAEGVDLWLSASTTDELTMTAVRSGAIPILLIGDGEQDARVLFELLERDIVPMFYGWNSEGIPLRWLERIRGSMR